MVRENSVWTGKSRCARCNTRRAISNLKRPGKTGFAAGRVSAHPARRLDFEDDPLKAAHSSKVVRTSSGAQRSLHAVYAYTCSIYDAVPKGLFSQTAPPYRTSCSEIVRSIGLPAWPPRRLLRPSRFCTVAARLASFFALLRSFLFFTAA